MKSDAPVQNLVLGMHTDTSSTPPGAVDPLSASQKRYVVALNRIIEPESTCETGRPGTSACAVSGLACTKVRFGMSAAGMDRIPEGRSASRGS